MEIKEDQREQWPESDYVTENSHSYAGTFSMRTICIKRPGNEDNNANHCHGGLTGVDEWPSQALNKVSSAHHTMFLSGHARSPSLHQPRPFPVHTPSLSGNMCMPSCQFRKCWFVSQTYYWTRQRILSNFLFPYLGNCCWPFKFIITLPKRGSSSVSCFSIDCFFLSNTQFFILEN